jgi:type IV fimbrial biogenesis protein FimT|tara:strand:+ start:8038 stop:8595 length:558 start_codon:yes stop_codon:yes gene_type:complete
MRREVGFTMIELLVTIAITGIILGFAFPSLVHIMERNHTAVSVNWLIGSIFYTRHAAIVKRTTVTLCPSLDGSMCGGKWHDGTIAFTDRNADARINGKDELLHRFASPTNGSTIKWRAFRNKQYLQMTQFGFTNYQNGNFVYCSEGRDPRYSRQIIINVQGRPRQARDRDGDGIVEDRRGRPLRC